MQVGLLHESGTTRNGFSGLTAALFGVRRGLDLGDAVIDGAGAVVPGVGELVEAIAVLAAVQELVALAFRAHDSQFSAVMASHKNVLGPTGRMGPVRASVTPA